MPRVKEQNVSYSVKPKGRYAVPSESIPPRKAVTSLLDRMKDSATYQDILYHVYVMHCIDQGEKDIREGHVYSHAQVQKMLAKWLK